MITIIQPDRAEIYRAIDLLIEPGEVFEIRVLNTGRTGTVRGYFDDIDAAVKEAITWSGKAPAVYITLNPVNPALLARAANRLETYAKTSTLDPDIVHRRWLLIDIDPIRPSGISSSDEEHEAALTVARVIYQFLRQRKWPEPIVADSGNGAHLLYRVDLPNDDDSRDLLQAVLQALALKFSDNIVDVDTGNFNAARISKLYGTAACKGDSVTARPHRLSRILSDNADELGTTHVTVDQLRQLVADLPKPKPKEAEKSAPKSHPRGRADDRPDYFAAVNDRAMANLPAWVPVLFPAAKTYKDGYRVKQKDLNRSYEEDLTIMPIGIVDYGVADQGDPKQGRRTPIDLVLEWGGVANAIEAAHWLCRQLGVDPGDLGWRPPRGKPAPTSPARTEPSAPPAPAEIDITALKERRLALEKRVADTDDVDDLALNVAAEVYNSFLSEPVKYRLMGLIATKLGISKAELTRSFKPAKADEPEPDPFADDGEDDLIKDLNSKHAVVKVGGRVCIMSQDYDPGLERPMLSFLTKADFELQYCNRAVGRGRNALPLGQYWLYSPKRRQYQGVVFAPGRNVSGYYNLFQGFGVKPDSTKSCGKFLDFLHDIICCQNEDLYDYLISWLAHLFQRPAELPGTAIVLRSPEQGTGKTTFVDTIGALVGRQHYIPLSSMHQVTGRFSGHLADVLLVHAAEAIWGGDKNSEGILKAMITDPMETIERKHQDAFSVPNFKRVMISTNNEWPIARDSYDRRVVVFDVSPDRAKDRSYFGPLWDEINNGGRAALMYALLEKDISGWSPSQVPESLQELGWDIKIRSGSTAMQWYFQSLQAEYLVPDDPDVASWPEDPEIKERLHGRYLRWCERMRIMHPMHMPQFSRELQGWGVEVGKNRYSGTLRPSFRLPELLRAREKFSAVVGLPADVWSMTDFDLRSG